MNRFGDQHGRFALDGRPGCVAEAREHARRLFRCACPPLSDAVVVDAQIAVAELVTNAVMHAPGACELEITIDEDRIAVAVHDGGLEMPVQRVPDLSGAGGFGLNMLHRMAGEVTTSVHAEGKTVSVALPR
jgi:anti-sigma regulatory factor (Ser/Thr protein kinase)